MVGREIQEFQFHLVRLKGRGGRGHSQQQIISIPPGPIEGLGVGIGRGYVHQFQFNLVRLKAG